MSGYGNTDTKDIDVVVRYINGKYEALLLEDERDASLRGDQPRLRILLRGGHQSTPTAAYEALFKSTAVLVGQATDLIKGPKWERVRGEHGVSWNL